MKTVAVCGLAGLCLIAAASASACDATLLSTFPDEKEVAKCVEDHERRISLQTETLDRWMTLHEKLQSLVFQQQKEIAKLSQEVFELRTKLVLQAKSKDGTAR